VDAKAPRARCDRRADSQGLVSDRERARRAALLRTAKPCGHGTRCWCQADGGSRTQPGFSTSR